MNVPFSIWPFKNEPIINYAKIQITIICEVLRGILFIVSEEKDIIKADFMPFERATLPTKMKIGIHLEELK